MCWRACLTKCSFLVLAVLAGIGLCAQDLVLLDFKSNEPLVNASVYNAGNGKVDYSNSKGQVFLTDAEDSHDLLVTLVGYHELLITAAQREKQEDRTFYLVQRTVKIPDAVVSVFGRSESLSEVPSQIEGRPHTFVILAQGRPIGFDICFDRRHRAPALGVHGFTLTCAGFLLRLAVAVGVVVAAVPSVTVLNLLRVTECLNCKQVELMAHLFPFFPADSE